MKGILLLILITFALSDNEYQIEDNVIVLTDDNFDKYILEHEFVLVKFYAPWCGHCKQLALEYSKAANTLVKENLFLAQVDVTIHKRISEKFDIQAYPTIKLFIKGNIIEYKGGRTEKDIIAWIRKKTGPAIKKLKTTDEIENIKEKYQMVIVYFGKDEKQVEAFEKIAKEDEEDNIYAVIDSDDANAKYAVKEGTIVLFKQFDERRNDLILLHDSNITEFIQIHSSPLVSKLNDKIASNILTNRQPVLFLYRDNTSDTATTLEKIIENVAKKANDIKVIVSDIKEEMEKKFSEFFGVKENKLPLIILLDVKVDYKKYFMKGNITEENILKFIDDWKNEKLKPFYLSQEIPEKQNDFVYVLVGQTFKDIVYNGGRDVLVKFYAPWCGHCQKLAPVYNELAMLLAHNPNLIIAEMDSTQNEVEGITIDKFPTIKFWKAESEEPIDYKGPKTIDGFEKFLQENCKYPITFEPPLDTEEPENQINEASNVIMIEEL